jgi:hypothetical protein
MMNTWVVKTMEDEAVAIPGRCVVNFAVIVTGARAPE